MEKTTKSKISNNKSVNEKLAEATDWLMLLNQDEVEENTKNSFKAWLVKDKNHPKYFQDILQVWQLSALIEPEFSEKIEQLVKR